MKQPQQRPAPVQWVRVRYAKRGVQRYASHMDISRALERAVRRAHIPIALSSGFTPHPRLSYAGACPTGVASEAEYVDMGLAELLPCGEIAVRLDRALPPGLDVLEVREIPRATLAHDVTVSQWQLDFAESVDADILRQAVERVATARGLTHVRSTPKGEKTLPVSEALVSLEVVSERRVRAVIGETTPLVRPLDLAEVILPGSSLTTSITRLAQGHISGGEVIGA